MEDESRHWKVTLGREGREWMTLTVASPTEREACLAAKRTADRIRTVIRRSAKTPGGGRRKRPCRLKAAAKPHSGTMQTAMASSHLVLDSGRNLSLWNDAQSKRDPMDWRASDAMAIAGPLIRLIAAHLKVAHDGKVSIDVGTSGTCGQGRTVSFQFLPAVRDSATARWRNPQIPEHLASAMLAASVGLACSDGLSAGAMEHLDIPGSATLRALQQRELEAGRHADAKAVAAFMERVGLSRDAALLIEREGSAPDCAIGA